MLTTDITYTVNHAIEQGGTLDTTLLKDNSLRDDLCDEGGRGRPGEVPQVRFALRLGDLDDALHGCHTGEKIGYRLQLFRTFTFSWFSQVKASMLSQH